MRLSRTVAGMAAATIALLVVMAPVTPASADDAVSVNVDPIGVDGGVATVSGSATMSNSLGLDQVTSVTISATSRQHSGTSDRCNGCGASFGQSSTSFSFTTRELPYNGPYDVVVEVSGKKVLDTLLNGAPVSTTETRSFNVEVAPAPPADVTAVPNPDRSVTAKWARNPEPDLVGYQVQRRGPATSGFQLVAPKVDQPPDGSTVSWTDTARAQSGGQFEYVVVAVRPDGNGEVSDRAPTAASARAQVSVPGPPGVPGAPGAPGTPGAPGSPAGGPGALATTGPGGAFATGSPAPLDLSSFLATGGAPPKIAVPGGVTLPDGTYSANLPFGPKNASDAGADSVEVLGHSTSRRTLLLPIATGLVMSVFALHLRRFNRQVLAPPLEH